ncbi:hypothetical protein BDK51DRAFT_31907 [Blyttiomyces helicus]|uniref:Uncharacterized protein n=1 Tax=Blyttiomyces helicus TaxID=388810 RepID=A0A4P9VZG3_9FUNG|nr:hypothetical protein BDK51DRAFT_31907 [Blyttiomyces helicus]|eukprot:RKO83758.1 hypothetical protein BDK51DRAFT_31907 [Blyttiomyces helicus]
MGPHRTFNPDPVVLEIIDGARELGLEPEFSQPYSAFVLSDVSTAEKFMDMVIAKSKAMGHPDTRAIRTIGVSFETEKESERALLTMALAEGLVAIFEISKICFSSRRLPTSLEYMLGKGGALKSYFNTNLKMHSVFNVDDFARANFLPDDSIRSLAAHVGVQSAAEHGHPDRYRHRRNADAALASLRLIRVLLHPPDGTKVAFPSRSAPSSASPSYFNLAPANVIASRHKLAFPSQSASSSASPSHSNLAPANVIAPRPKPASTPSSNSNLSLTTYIVQVPDLLPKKKKPGTCLNYMDELNVLPTSPEAMDVLKEQCRFTTRTMDRIRPAVSELASSPSVEKLTNLILKETGKKPPVPVDRVIMEMMEACAAPLSDVARAVLENELPCTPKQAGGIVRALTNGDVRPTFGELLIQLLVAAPDRSFPYVWRVGLLMVVAERSKVPRPLNDFYRP